LIPKNKALTGDISSLLLRPMDAMANSVNQKRLYRFVDLRRLGEVFSTASLAFSPHASLGLMNNAHLAVKETMKALSVAPSPDCEKSESCQRHETRLAGSSLRSGLKCDLLPVFWTDHC
jgi:hypothetical protein